MAENSTQILNLKKWTPYLSGNQIAIIAPLQKV